MKKYSSVDDYISAQGRWIEAINKLRSLFHTTEMEETLKWSLPTYSINGKNVAGIAAFKSYVGIWFFQGVFLRDEKGVLINAQKDKTVAMRQWRFQAIEDIDESLVKAYLAEAIQNQKDGKEIKPLKKKALVIPDELKAVLSKQQDLREVFNQLGLSKKREFAAYIDTAKRDSTKQSRLLKIIPMIKEGVGLSDKYR